MTRRRTRRRGSSRAATAMAMALLAIAGCGVPQDGSPRRVPDVEVPDGLRNLDDVAPKPPTELQTVDVWFVRDDTLVVRQRRVDAAADEATVLEELLRGPNELEREASLRSAIPDAEAVVSVSVGGGLATVALAPMFAEIPANDQIFAVGQIVLTLTDLPGVGRVGFVVDEKAVAVPLPIGEPTTGSVSRDDFLLLTVPTEDAVRES